VGRTKIQKIAVLAALHLRQMTVHNTQPTICPRAHLRFCAVHPHVPYWQEYNIEPVRIRERWPIRKTPLQIVNGEIAVPDGPELGVEVDEELTRRLVHKMDGAVGL